MRQEEDYLGWGFVNIRGEVSLNFTTKVVQPTALLILITSEHGEEACFLTAQTEEERRSGGWLQRFSINGGDPHYRNESRAHGLIKHRARPEGDGHLGPASIRGLESEYRNPVVGASLGVQRGQIDLSALELLSIDLHASPHGPMPTAPPTSLPSALLRGAHV